MLLLVNTGYDARMSFITSFLKSKKQDLTVLKTAQVKKITSKNKGEGSFKL